MDKDFEFNEYMKRVEDMCKLSLNIKDILDDYETEVKLPVLANLMHEYAEAEGWNPSEMFSNMADVAKGITL